MNGQPQLVGTQKQVAWAERLRERALRVTHSPDMFRHLSALRDARWWITNRDEPSEALYVVIVKMGAYPDWQPHWAWRWDA